MLLYLRIEALRKMYCSYEADVGAGGKPFERGLFRGALETTPAPISGHQFDR